MAKHGTGTWTYYIICAYTSLRHWVCLGDRGRWEVRKAKVIPCGSFHQLVSCLRDLLVKGGRGERASVVRRASIRERSAQLFLVRLE